MQHLTRENDFIYEIIESIYPKSEYTRSKFTKLDRELFKLFEHFDKRNEVEEIEFEQAILPIELFKNHYSVFLSVFSQLFLDIAKRYCPKHLTTLEFADELKTDLWVHKKENVCSNYRKEQRFLPYIASVLRCLAIDKYRADTKLDMNLRSFEDYEDIIELNSNSVSLNHEFIDHIKEHYHKKFSKELLFFKILNNIKISSEELELVHPVLSKHYRKMLVTVFNKKELPIIEKINSLNKVFRKLSKKTYEIETVRKNVDVFIQNERKHFKEIEAKDLKRILIYIFDNNY